MSKLHAPKGSPSVSVCVRPFFWRLWSELHRSSSADCNQYDTLHCGLCFYSMESGMPSTQFRSGSLTQEAHGLWVSWFACRSADQLIRKNKTKLQQFCRNLGVSVMFFCSVLLKLNVADIPGISVQVPSQISTGSVLLIDLQVASYEAQETLRGSQENQGT